MDRKDSSDLGKFNEGDLEVLARLAKLINPVHLNALHCCNFNCLSDLQEEGLVLQKTEEHLVSYQLTKRGIQMVRYFMRVFDYLSTYKRKG